MNPLVSDWIEKAEGDYHAAGRELRECAEKYLKAFLQLHEQEIPKIHKLIDLLVLTGQVDSSLEILRSDLEVLERYSACVRYPGTTAEKEDARAAFSAVKVVRETMRRMLELTANE